MKRMFITMGLAVALIAGLGVYISRSETSVVSAIELANIEALTNEEGGGEQIVSCYCKTNWFSPNICSANASGAYCGGDPCSNHDGNCR